jgi:hypothetical protein
MDADCFGFEIVNSCGDFVMSLYGSIDEEPIAFAEEFAATHCGVCGVIPQTVTMRRPIASRPPDEVPSGRFIENFEPLCVEHQCVLGRFESR